MPQSTARSCTSEWPEALLLPGLLQGIQPKVLKYGINAGPQGIVALDPPCCSMLYSFEHSLVLSPIQLLCAQYNFYASTSSPTTTGSNCGGSDLWAATPPSTEALPPPPVLPAPHAACASTHWNLNIVYFLGRITGSPYPECLQHHPTMERVILWTRAPGSFHLCIHWAPPYSYKTTSSIPPWDWYLGLYYSICAFVCIQTWEGGCWIVHYIYSLVVPNIWTLYSFFPLYICRWCNSFFILNNVV